MRIIARHFLLLLLLIYSTSLVTAQSLNPKRDFRGAWVATVINLDWPSSNTLSTIQQKEELIQIFDKLEETNINAVIFQIRTECDAFYASNYDPWSYWLTGNQGTPPSPYYDPLQFAIEEAHKRGLELHAWFNPYRVERQVGNYSTAANHISNLHPDWTIRIGNIRFLDPGLPDVRDYVRNVVMDVVNRYDIDGIHFDDYFYPYPPDQIGTEDLDTFNEYNRGIFDIGDWRRDNVNELLRMINDSLQIVKPHVKFGMSPFGIYKNGVPPGISGLDAYSSIYCDPVAWLNEKIIDYLAPQLYWQFGGGQDYGKLLPWWAEQTEGRHLYPGQALYRAGSFPPDEIPRQIRLNRATDNVFGNILFRAQNLNGNPNGVTDSLVNNYYITKALAPQMSWKDSIAPLNPANLRFETLVDSRGLGLSWDTPNIAIDGDTASKYVIYQLDDLTPQAEDFDDPANIWKVQNLNYSLLDKAGQSSQKMYFSVTALDENNNESAASNVVEVEVQIPEIPLLVGPADNAQDQRDTTLLTWNNSLYSSKNRLQISEDSIFSDVLFDFQNISDTSKKVTGLDGLAKYYWRVSASNIAGESDFSETRSFTTGFPIPPTLLFPEDKSVDIAVEPEMIWNESPVTSDYQVQIAEGLSIEPSIIKIDTLVSDTSFIASNLAPDKIFSWHVRSKNEFGFSKWSNISKFKTASLTGTDDRFVPVAFNLEQNYPNPFNPVTNIKFSIPENNLTTLKIYDLLGREVIVLVNQFMSQGNYEVKFDGTNYSSGMYVYVLTSGENISSKKMLLIK